MTEEVPHILSDDNPDGRKLLVIPRVMKRIVGRELRNRSFTLPIGIKKDVTVKLSVLCNDYAYIICSFAAPANVDGPIYQNGIEIGYCIFKSQYLGS